MEDESESAMEDESQSAMEDGPTMDDQLDHFESRFESIDEKIRDKWHKEESESAMTDNKTPVAQRVKKLTYKIVNHAGVELTVVMGRDTELYLRSDMSNKDLEHCTVTGPPLAVNTPSYDREFKDMKEKMKEKKKGKEVHQNSRRRELNNHLKAAAVSNKLQKRKAK